MRVSWILERRILVQRKSDKKERDIELCKVQKGKDREVRTGQLPLSQGLARASARHGNNGRYQRGQAQEYCPGYRTILPDGLREREMGMVMR